MKSLKNLGQTLSKSEQKTIHGGRDAFIGSICYGTMSRCQAALASAISNGANPVTSGCVSCTTPWGTSGFMVQARV